MHFKKHHAIITKLSVRHAPLAQLDRASGYGPEGRGFESLRAYQKSSETERFQNSFALCTADWQEIIFSQLFDRADRQKNGCARFLNTDV